MTDKDIHKLLQWYYTHQRDLPWRRTEDPYAIWLSEIMLQQTQVDTVIPYFERFLQAYPTIHSLAAAEQDQVFKLWEGLGYYSRAKRLILCAKQVVDQHGGIFPKTRAEMLNLPGIGPYTAGAVLSIAYNVKEPAVDGNVLRVMARYLTSDLDIGDPKNRTAFEEQLRKNLPEDMRGFAQALMELGATICTPRSPKCSECPVQSGCLALKTNRVTELPIKRKKKASPTLQVAVALIDCDGKYLMYQKEDSGLLGGFWAFPYGVGDTKEAAIAALKEWLTENMGSWWLDLNALIPSSGKLVKHVFTHQIWQMLPYYATIETTTRAKLHIDYPSTRWVDETEVNHLAVTTAMRKIVQQIRRI